MCVKDYDIVKTIMLWEGIHSTQFSYSTAYICFRGNREPSVTPDYNSELDLTPTYILWVMHEGSICFTLQLQTRSTSFNVPQWILAPSRLLWWKQWASEPGFWQTHLPLTEHHSKHICTQRIICIFHFQVTTEGQLCHILPTTTIYLCVLSAGFLFLRITLSLFLI